MAGRSKTTDPFWWALFSTGGTIAAFLVPIHVLLTGLAIAFGWISREAVSYERMRELLANPLVRLYLFVFMSLPLFHAAHRIRYLLKDLGLRRFPTPLAVICYGVALAATSLAAFLLVYYF